MAGDRQIALPYRMGLPVWHGTALSRRGTAVVRRLSRDQRFSDYGRGSGPIAMPDQADTRRKIRAQISGFGKAANRPAATAQPSRWRADGGATALDHILRRFLQILNQSWRSDRASRASSWMTAGLGPDQVRSGTGMATMG